MRDESRERSIRATQQTQIERREFLAATAAIGSFPFLSGAMGGASAAASAETLTAAPAPTGSSIIGSYGPWAAGLVDDPPQLSFRRQEWDDLEAWRSQARRKAAELIASPKEEPQPKPMVTNRYTHDGLEIEELSCRCT